MSKPLTATEIQNLVQSVLNDAKGEANAYALTAGDLISRTGLQPQQLQPAMEALLEEGIIEKVQLGGKLHVRLLVIPEDDTSGTDDFFAPIDETPGTVEDLTFEVDTPEEVEEVVEIPPTEPAKLPEEPKKTRGKKSTPKAETQAEPEGNGDEVSEITTMKSGDFNIAFKPINELSNEEIQARIDQCLPLAIHLMGQEYDLASEVLMRFVKRGRRIIKRRHQGGGDDND